MADEMITTGVDDLLEYLKGKDKVAMQDAATVLGIKAETIQAWVDFLVEEKILGIEYKFTKPFIYLNKGDAKPKTKVIEHTSVSIEEAREAYAERAKAKQIPGEKIAELWKKHVAEALERKKDYFMEQAARRHAEKPEALWERYRNDVLGRC